MLGFKSILSLAVNGYSGLWISLPVFFIKSPPVLHQFKYPDMQILEGL